MSNSTTSPESLADPSASPLSPHLRTQFRTTETAQNFKDIAKLSPQAVENLQRKLRGQMVRPSDLNYDQVRTIWNAMIQRRPALIVRCVDADDVPPCLAFAREHALDLSIRGGGHNIAGNALCDHGLMLDFSLMKNVRVNAGQRRVVVEPGATLADLDQATQLHKLATPVGINSTTGIAGLTLGGGFGWLTRKYGMTADNLVSAEVVIADGQKLRASEKENPDLFWAIRGGGGNFGVVTQFEFKLHEVGPEILAGLIVFPLEQARQVLIRYREFVALAPEELNVWAVVRKAPPLPFLPEDVHGKEVIALIAFYLGEAAQGEKLIAPLRGFGVPYGEHIGPQPYTQWQTTFDPLLTPGARNYWKSHNFTELSDDALDSVIEFAGKLPSAECEIFLGLIAGAANRVPANAMAYRHRDAKFVLNVHGRWQDQKDDERCIAWARAFFQASAPYASAGAYVNFMTDEESSRIPAAYGENYDRLTQIKKRFDPDNLFHLNQNIKPSSQR